MRKILIVGALAFVLMSCEQTIEQVPRTTVVVSVGSAGPALQALLNFLPEGLTVNVPSDWDTLSVETATMGVLVDAQPCTTATCIISGHQLNYDTTTGLYLPIDTTGLPSYMEINPGDGITVYSTEDTVSGSVPSCPGVVLTDPPDSLQAGTDLVLNWSYDSGTPDSVMISVKAPGHDTYNHIMAGSNTSYTVPGSQLDSAGVASVSVSALEFQWGLDGATPGSFILYTRSEFAPVVIY